MDTADGLMIARGLIVIGLVFIFFLKLYLDNNGE